MTPTNSLPPRRFPLAELLDWWDREQRPLPWRRDRSPWKTWVSEVMLQQTRVDTVIPYFLRFIHLFPTPAHLAAAGSDAVMKSWEGLGYYQRVRNLVRAAREVTGLHQGVIPCDPDVFARFPGVGEYIRAAVMSIACGRPLPAVDGNVVRIVARYRGDRCDTRTPAFLRRTRRVLHRVIPAHRPGDFNEALMELGALVCRPRNPACSACPLAITCRARALGLTETLPLRTKRPRPPLRQVAVGVVMKNGRLLIRRRPEGGHLGGLWEFPGGRIHFGESPRAAVTRLCGEELGMKVGVGDLITEVSHAYTHFRIRMGVFLVHTADEPDPAGTPPEDLRWIRPAELEAYPFPRANIKAFPAILAALTSGNEECQ